MIQSRLAKSIAGATISVLMAGSICADESPTTFDALVEAAFAENPARRDAWSARYPSFTYDPVKLLELGELHMELWGEVDGKMASLGITETVAAELIGVYEPETRTFTWGWATDDFPNMGRSAVDAVRAYGEAHDIEELTNASREDRPAFASVSNAIAALLGDLQFEDVLRERNAPHNMIFFGVPRGQQNGTNS